MNINYYVIIIIVEDKEIIMINNRNKWERVNTKLKNFDVYVRYVSTSHILNDCNVIDTDVFSNLESIKSIRKKDSSLVISYDVKKHSEYNEEGNMINRKIVSYCFSVLMPDKVTALQVLFLNTNINDDKRLSVCDCLSYVLHYCYESEQFTTLYYSTKYRLLYYDATGKYQKKMFNCLKDAKTFIKDKSLDGIIFKCDRSHVSTSEAKKLSGIKTKVCLLGHAGIKDITAFTDKDDARFINNISSLQNGIVTLNNKGISFVVKDYEKRYYEYPFVLTLRDSECYSPSGDKTLNPMKKCLHIPIDDTVSNIDDCAIDVYKNKNMNDFMDYASSDSLISLLFTAKIWGINKAMPVSITSASATYLQDNIIDYFGIDEEKSTLREEKFKHIYEGFNKQQVTEVDEFGRVRNKTYYNKTYTGDKIDKLGQKSFVGGYNICPVPGIFKTKTYDYDVINAYSTGLSLLVDADWTVGIDNELLEQEVSLEQWDSINDIIFAEVDFEFPKSVKFPNIPIRVDDSIVFPRSGKHVCVCGSTMYLALKLGAKIYAHDFIKVKPLLRDDGSRSMCLRPACKQLIADREKCKKVYGNKSLEEIIEKLLNNGGYGKVGQCVTEKKTGVISNKDDEMMPSCITSKYRAAMVTALVRDLIIAVANEIDALGYHFYSATTDGFISDIPKAELDKIKAYGFMDLFREARMYLTDNPEVWSEKHEQEALLLNITTRGNVGFGYNRDEDKCVCAHAGFKTGEAEDSYNDRISLFKTVVLRTDKPKYTYDLWSNLKDIIRKKQDFTIVKSCKSANFNYDLKRKPNFDTLYDASGVFDGIEYFFATFDTEPYDTVDEYKQYKDLGRSYEVLKTSADWKDYQMRLRMKQSGKNIKISNYAWTQLVSVIRLYRQNKISIPVLDKCDTLKEKLIAINIFNHSNRHFTETNWKSCARADRMNQILPFEDIKELLDSIDAKFIDTGEHSGN
jgi:hypothetical protein